MYDWCLQTVTSTIWYVSHVIWLMRNLIINTWGPVHTNPFSNENGAVLLSSTLQRRKRSPKTEPFERALQGAAIWKRCFLKRLVFSVDGENDAIWKRWRHQNRHDRAPDHSTVSIQNGGQTLPSGFSIDQRCSVDGRKRYENDKRGRKSFWKRSKTAPFSFMDRASVTVYVNVSD